MSTKSPTPFHNFWGQFTSVELPNVAASTTQDVALEVGDIAYDTTVTSLVVCQTATLGSAVWGTVGGGVAAPVHFQVNDSLNLISTPTNFLDGLREVGVGARVLAVIISQEIDGASGATTVELFKIDTAGTETQITTGGTASLAQGGGAKARGSFNTFNGGTEVLASNDRLGIKLTAVQTDGEDLTVTVLLERLTIPAFPNDRVITQALNRSVTGTTFDLVGSIYLEQGTILAADSRVMMGVDNAINDAELEIRRFTGGAVVGTITATGLLQDAQPVGDILIAVTDWYDLNLRADTGGVVATILGLRFVFELGLGVRIRQAIDEEQLGLTPKLVGSVFLPAGTLQVPARVMLGTDTGVDVATLELRRFTGGALVATWTATGALQDTVQSTTVGIAAEDWYDLFLFSDDGGATALVEGIDWTVLA